MYSVVSVYVKSKEKQETVRISDNDNELSRFLFTVGNFKDAADNLILSREEICLFDFETQDDEATTTTQMIDAKKMFEVIHKLHLAIANKEIQNLDTTFRHPQHFYISFNKFYEVIKMASDNHAKVQIIDFYS